MTTTEEVHAAVSPYLEGVVFPTNFDLKNITGTNTTSSVSFNHSCENNNSDIYDICYTTWEGKFLTYGYGLIIQTTTTSFIKDNYYGLTMFFGTNDNSYIIGNSYTSYSNLIGASGGWNAISTPATLESRTDNACIDLGEQYNPHVYGYRYLCSYTQVFKANATGTYFWTPFNTSKNITFYEEDLAFLGYSLSSQGSKPVSAEEISNTLQVQFNAISSEINDMKTEQEETNEKLDEQIQQDKEQHDEIMNSDISEEDKELPDDSKYQDYTDTENDLKDKVNQADMSVISIGIDSNSSSWVWDTLTSLIQSHTAVFGMFIAILSIGIIKLALGR